MMITKLVTAVLFLVCSFSVGLRLHSLKSHDQTYVPSDPTGKMVVCTQVKDEMAYLPEWIAFHRALGVDQFDIYNHHSSDGVEKLPAMYAAAGKPYVNVYKAQAQDWSFTDCVQRNKDAAWVGVFDVDEFMSLQPNSNRYDGLVCNQPRLKCLLDEKKKLGYEEVHFPTLRFSSNKQVWRYGNPSTAGFASQQQLSGSLKRSSLQQETELKTLPLDCNELSLRKKSVQPVDVCGGGEIPTIVGSHIFRGPSEDIAGENYKEHFLNQRACTDKQINKEAGAPPCRHGPGKSFVQPQKCDVYTVHGCHQRIPRFNVSITDARLNHYYTRSAEDACKHASGWKNSAPLAVYKYVDDGFFKLIKDESAPNSVSHTQMQKDIASVMCGKKATHAPQNSLEYITQNYVEK